MGIHYHFILHLRYTRGIKNHVHRGVGKENCKEGKGLCIRYLEIEAEENESEKTFSRIKGIPCKEDLER